MINIFDLETTSKLIERIENLTPNSKAIWGKMDVAQMLAHSCVSYEMVFEDKYPKPGKFKVLLLKTLVKPFVVGDKPYKTNIRTAPEFIIKSDKDFEKEKARLIDFINKTQQAGASFFENRESHSFGKLNTKEWNTLFYKHLDHHLRQFGV